jgi:hypothetical protein
MDDPIEVLGRIAELIDPGCDVDGAVNPGSVADMVYEFVQVARRRSIPIDVVERDVLTLLDAHAPPPPTKAWNVEFAPSPNASIRASVVNTPGFAARPPRKASRAGTRSLAESRHGRQGRSRSGAGSSAVAGGWIKSMRQGRAGAANLCWSNR